jgi:hypothetical protein
MPKASFGNIRKLKEQSTAFRSSNRLALVFKHQLGCGSQAAPFGFQVNQSPINRLFFDETHL